MKTGVKVIDAMTRSPITISENDSCLDCARLMIKEGVGGVIVKKGYKVTGIITEKDLVQKIVSKGKDPRKTGVKKVMCKKIVSIAPDADLYDAVRKMVDYDIRRLPIIHGGKFIGLLTEKDVIKVEPGLFDLLAERLEVREETRKPVYFNGLKKGKCESCGDFARLYDIEDGLFCRMCKQQRFQ